MIKKFKDLQVGDRCYVRNQQGEFLKIQIAKKEEGQTYFGIVDDLEWHQWIGYPTVTAPPEKLIPVYSHATLLSNTTNHPL